MPYTNLLNQLIQKSGMTAKEVAAKCQAAGANITPSYLSMIRNEKSARIPSDDVSIALAKALGED
ncbi:MAG: helix-turn-helix transcriptional regulator, partial [Ruthenibacterium sp.]